MLSRAGLLSRRIHPSYASIKCLTRPASNSSESPNQGIIERLEKSRYDEESSPTRNAYKVGAFTRAIRSIRALRYPLTHADQARMIPGIGQGIAGRIAAHLAGEVYNPESRLVVAKKVEQDIESKLLAMKRLQVIPGIGPTVASKLVDAGCQNVEDLRLPEFNKMLLPAMRIGLDFLGHLDKPVTREEAEIVLDFIRENLSCKFEASIVGSYRRGAPSSADIDVLLLHPSYVNVPVPVVAPSKSHHMPRGRPKVLAISKTGKNAEASRHETPLLGDAVWPLQDRGLIAATLSAGPYKWQGIIRIPRKHADGRWEPRMDRMDDIHDRKGEYRRLDLNMIPVKSRGAALLALTGDLEFNRDLRVGASKLGMHLNEYGLWRWVSHNSESSSSAEDADEAKDKGHWELMQADSEETILHELGKSWIEPSKRNFSYLLDSKVKRGKGRPRLSVSLSSQSGRGNHTLAGETDTPRKRGRPRKVVAEEEEVRGKTPVGILDRLGEESVSQPEEIPKRPRGRPRKPAPQEDLVEVDEIPKRPRGRPRKSVQEDA